MTSYENQQLQVVKSSLAWIVPGNAPTGTRDFACEGISVPKKESPARLLRVVHRYHGSDRFIQWSISNVNTDQSTLCNWTSYSGSLNQTETLGWNCSWLERPGTEWRAFGVKNLQWSFCNCLCTHATRQKSTRHRVIMALSWDFSNTHVHKFLCV